MEELTGIRGRRHRHLLGDVKERRSYGNLKDEELARDRWRTLIEEAIYMSYNTLRDCVVVVVVGGGGGGGSGGGGGGGGGGYDDGDDKGEAVILVYCK